MPITKAPSSSTAAALPRAIMFQATWNSGKSFLAASASKFYPPLPWVPYSPGNTKPADFPLVKLDDLFYHAWEPDCFAGFADGGLAVPPHWDMSSVTGGELDSTINEVCAETARRVKSGETRVVVVDTASAFNTHAHALAMFGMLGATKDDDGQKALDSNMQKVWGAILSRHQRYMTGLLSANPELIIFNVHPKASDPNPRGNKSDLGAAKLHAANMKAKGLGSEATLTPDITGQAMGLYIRNCSIVAYIETETKSVPVPGKPGQFMKQTTRYLNPHKKDDVLARSKYSCLGEKEPADLRVIFDKIRKGGDPPMLTLQQTPGV